MKKKTIIAFIVLALTAATAAGYDMDVQMPRSNIKKKINALNGCNYFG